ncbi:hypothetical protein Pmani_023845 [Petrolisthes manimaculis]|uniref:Uncharacterized protein n=1 Tax=Petrolisthes manimaculis TaxID=1843537 RepID=A0AAE1PB95_9EUCA|nr:hypothetical protein Pmani_023845 [Petrolisthes manimaculis]
MYVSQIFNNNTCHSHTNNISTHLLPNSTLYNYVGYIYIPFSTPVPQQTVYLTTPTTDYFTFPSPHLSLTSHLPQATSPLLLHTCPSPHTYHRLLHLSFSTPVPHLTYHRLLHLSFSTPVPHLTPTTGYFTFPSPHLSLTSPTTGCFTFPSPHLSLTSHLPQAASPFLLHTCPSPHTYHRLLHLSFSTPVPHLTYHRLLHLPFSTPVPHLTPTTGCFTFPSPHLSLTSHLPQAASPFPEPACPPPPPDQLTHHFWPFLPIPTVAF